MATPKQVVFSPVDIDDAEYVDFSQIDPKLEEENLEFEKFKAEMHESQDDAKITVSKKLTDSQGQPLGRKAFQCFACGIDDYDFTQICTRIREEFGTGLYKIQGRDSNGKFKFGKTVGILAPTIPGEEKSESTGALFDKMSDALARQQDRTEAMVKDLIGPTSGVDPIDQMTKMMAAMGAMMGAMGIERQPPVAAKTLVEQLTEFKMIKELFGGDSDGELSGGDDNIYSLLKSTVSAFGGPIAQALAAGAQSGELDADGLAIQGKLPAPEPKTDEAMEQEKHNIEMRKNIHILIQNAKTEIPPEAFAGILVTNTPEDKQDQLWDFISSEKCVDEIIRLEPAAAEYRKWFDALRDAVIKIMADPENADLQDDTGESSLPESEAVAGEGDPPHDPDNGDTPEHT